jgi:hypothetical protein
LGEANIHRPTQFCLLFHQSTSHCNKTQIKQNIVTITTAMPNRAIMQEDQDSFHVLASLGGVQPKRRQVACTSVGFAYFNSLA